jgi:hypothetical protein
MTEMNRGAPWTPRFAASPSAALSCSSVTYSSGGGDFLSPLHHDEWERIRREHTVRVANESVAANSPSDWRNPLAMVVDRVRRLGMTEGQRRSSTFAAMALHGDETIYVSTSRGRLLTPAETAVLDAEIGTGRWQFVGGAGHAEENLAALAGQRTGVVAASNLICETNCQPILSQSRLTAVSPARLGEGTGRLPPLPEPASPPPFLLPGQSEDRGGEARR